MKRQSLSDPSRRDLFRGAGVGVAAGLLAGSAATAKAASIKPQPPTVYTRIGVRPFINLKAAYTIDGGLLTLPEVKHAMEDASYHSVNLDELMAKVGERLGQLFGAEYGIVSAGGAASLSLATAACVAGGNTERIQFLPHPELAGLKTEVIMPRASRNEYDHAVRAVGVKIINIDTRDEFRRALGKQTALVVVLGSNQGRIPLEQMVADAHEKGVPVLIDASPEVPKRPNPYLSRGVDMVSYSGGKYLCGPQCSGVLLGRKDLVHAAWVNCSPHHGLNRTMKVGKEEIMGLLAAVETYFQRRNYQEDVHRWDQALSVIAQRVSQVPGIKTQLLPPPGVNPHPILRIDWDPEKIPIDADELHTLFLEGEPRLMTHAEGGGHSFDVRAAGMKPGDEKLAADRIHDVFVQASKKAKRTPKAPAMNITGAWNVEIQYVSGSARHRFQLETAGNRVTGTHNGEFAKGAIQGTVDGTQVVLRSRLPFDSIKLPFVFRGALNGGRMSGQVDLGEHGTAKWSARREA
ncbi:MAG TPA: aminotransferase class V-fold PLP-dependent enzyme [Bryobacteraceae bacterium]|nr:aminotransferase class V-fold PLP-dependent enzyme [Bryobacteraceae bacterium]